MASRPFQFLEKKRSKIRKRASKHFEGLAALSTHSAGQRAEVKAGCKPVHFSLETLHKTGLSAERYFSRGNHYEEYRDYWENGNYTFSRNENPELVYVRARDIEGVYLSDRELGNPEGFWTRNGREGWSRENILRRASHIQDVRQNTESGMSLDELSQNPVLDDTIRSYYNNPVQVAQVGSYYVFQSDGRHRTLAAQSLDTYIPVLVTGSYTRND